MQTLLLVSHTHWDREWYLTFEQYRTRLTKTFDTILDVLEGVPRFHSFAFDGQTVPIDDYLEVRPEARERLRKQIAAEKLIVGPQYVLTDGYAATGETWVRNMALGAETCAEMGHEPGYVYITEPTNLPEQFPQILNGLGFDSAIFGRGLALEHGDDPDTANDQSEYYWTGPVDSRLLVVHMPAYYEEDGSRCILHYCAAAEVFWGPEYDPLRETVRTVTADNTDDAMTRIGILREYLTPLATSDTLLFMHGCDHLPPQPDTPELVDAVNARLKDAGMVHGTFPAYLDAIRRSGRIDGDRHLARSGESRSRGGALSRIYVRRLHSDAVVSLERWMEPAAAMSRASGGPGDMGLMRQAWRYMLQNLAHDTIWGCSVDDVYDEVKVRFGKCTQIADEVAGEALKHVASDVDTTAAGSVAGARPYVAFQTTGWDADDVAEMEFWLPADENRSELSVVDDQGRRWPTQVLESKVEMRRVDRFDRTALTEHVRAVRALVRTEGLSGTGYSAVTVSGADDPRDTDLSVGQSWIENELLRVDVEPDGSFSMTDKRTGRVTEGLNRIVDQGDGGHGWRYNRVENDDFVHASEFPGHIRVMEAGPVRATLEVRSIMQLPDGLSADGKSRLRRVTACELTVTISLVAGIPRVEVGTALDNRVLNHRLRAVVPTGVVSDSHSADGAFAVHERSTRFTDMTPVKQMSGIGYHPSTPEETCMMHTFVDVSDGERGVAVLTKGVPQYEVQRDTNGSAAFALTLMRAAVGHTRFHDPDLTHGGQCLGEQAAEYAIVPHAGGWLEGGVHVEAARYVSPPRFVPTSVHGGGLGSSGAWMSALPNEIALSAMKPAQDGNGTIVRMVNLAREGCNAVIEFSGKPVSVSRCDLRERATGRLVVSDSGGVSVEFAPMEIVTLRLEW